MTKPFMSTLFNDQGSTVLGYFDTYAEAMAVIDERKAKAKSKWFKKPREGYGICDVSQSGVVDGQLVLATRLFYEPPPLRY